MTNNRPFLTAELPGTAGTIKNQNEDFFVEEIPLYNPSGQGTHLYFQIEKNNLSTMDAIQAIAKALFINKQDVGYAGQKDAKAITRQWLSIEHILPDRLENINIPGIKILDCAYHNNKLKLTHLSGNIFSIKIRNIDNIDQALQNANAIAEILLKRGVPNYYGSQRFGYRNDTHLLGAAVIAEDDEKLVELLMGNPHPDESDEIQAARKAFDDGDFLAAASLWPKKYRSEIQMAWQLYDKKPFAKIANAIDKQKRRFYISAFQSELFNNALARRLDTIDQILPGDIACIGSKGPTFVVEDPAAEQHRCDSFEIHPTGPIFGHKMQTPTDGPQLDIENDILKELKLKLEHFKGKSARLSKGARRPLRFQMENFKLEKNSDQLGDYLQVNFQLPPGCYATTVLREIIKDPAI